MERHRDIRRIASHARALLYICGVPGALVPDQLKSGVTKACRYEPGVQRTYEEMARHYGTVVLANLGGVLPARSAAPDLGDRVQP